MQPLRIALVDDHEVVRAGLRAILERRPGFDVVGEGSDAEQAVEIATSLQPDVIIMDARLPGRSGIDACRQITRLVPRTRVIMLTSYAEDEYLRAAVAAGASGYVLKQIDSTTLLQNLERVRQGESLLDPSLTATVFAWMREVRRREKGEAFGQLSEQQIRILALVKDGKTNRQIADSIGLSEKTVRNYVSEILGKLGLSTRTQAAAYAVEHGLDEIADDGS